MLSASSILLLSSYRSSPCLFSRQFRNHPCYPSPSSPSFSSSNLFSRQFSKYPGNSLCYSSSFSSPSLTGEDEFDMELERLLALFPEEIRRKVSEHSELRHLIEVVMDLGRRPLARFPSGDFVLSDHPMTFDDLHHATSQVGDFAVDNRAGISRTLHRISAIRNRKGVIIGLTCRVGRAVSGSANLLKDLIVDGSSLLLIGPPGVGKTTIIREIARMLADEYKKRVMIVDTSNEIGGDGDIPHAGIGYARRMQVPNTDMQHKILIEAVENHMPQVIVIDEIGTKLEAMAASTIAQRGIQLVATAHGVTIENLIMNPSLEMLVGGIQSVTLGDEEASRRGGQKTVLERKGPSTFTCGVEIISKTELHVHRSLEATVDALLSGRAPKTEVRKTIPQEDGHVMLTTQRESSIENSSHIQDDMIAQNILEKSDDGTTKRSKTETTFEFAAEAMGNSCEDVVPMHLYVYGILETSVIQGIRQLKVDDKVELTDNISEADALLALHARLKKNSRIQAVAKSHNLPIYVTKTSSLVQITKAIRALLNESADVNKDSMAEDKMNSSEQIDAIEEARLAIEQVVIPKGEPVDLLPRSAHIISLQTGLVQEYQLTSKKIGREPNTRLRILPFDSGMAEGRQSYKMTEKDSESVDNNMSGDENGSLYSVERLPLLPD